ncbi:hypothetical protein [Silicimonas sp. MF1-12-2]|uniref:hypothetical protein n=1 Tax=Silicimonas sp. MF1-12-2 TaxID=3384793 RepID=UPI0039B4114D
MTRKFEIGLGLLALLCFVAAANARLGFWGSETGSSGGTHASLFLAAGLAFAGFAVSSLEIAPRLRQRGLSRPEGLERRRLIVAIVYVARSCDGASPRDVAEVYKSVTGEELEKGEVAKAVAFLRTARGAPLERILSKIADKEEKERILAGACQLWFHHGAESERATRAIERVAGALGLEGNDINAALDAPWSTDASRLFRDIESIARRTVSRATSEAQRITTRIRGIG